MKRSVVLLGLFITVICIFGLFQIKYRVQNLERDLVEIERQINVNNKELTVLKAEWTYLSSPSRLEKLAKKHLSTSYVKVSQIKDMADLTYQTYRLANNSKNASKGKIKPTLKPTLSNMRKY